MDKIKLKTKLRRPEILVNPVPGNLYLPVIILLTMTLILMMVMVAGTGCSKAVTEETEAPGESPEETGEVEIGEEAGEEIGTPIAGADNETDRSTEIENEFNQIEKKTENIEALFNFIDENIADSDIELASNMVYGVIKLCEDYRQEFVNKLNDLEVTDTVFALLPSIVVDGELDLETLRDVNNEKVKNIVEEAIDKKYKLILIEGMIEPIVDYRAYDEYLPYLDFQMKEYLDVKADESDEPFVMDGAITITADELVGRILKSTEYLENYPDSPAYDEIKQLNDWRMWVYLGGIDNNRVFGSDGRILPEKLSEFEDMLAEYSDTGFGEILASYLELLEQENYMRTERIDDFLNNIYSI